MQRDTATASAAAILRTVNYARELVVAFVLAVAVSLAGCHRIELPPQRVQPTDFAEFVDVDLREIITKGLCSTEAVKAGLELAKRVRARSPALAKLAIYMIEQALAELCARPGANESQRLAQLLEQLLRIQSMVEHVSNQLDGIKQQAEINELRRQKVDAARERTAEERYRQQRLQAAREHAKTRELLRQRLQPTCGVLHYRKNGVCRDVRND